MSLSEQFQRVDGSQNDILKALAQSYGINTDGLKIDQIAAAVKASKKFKLNGLLSVATAGEFGLGADATPDDVFAKINALIDGISAKSGIIAGTYTGNGKTSQFIDLGAEVKAVFVTRLYNPFSANGSGLATKTQAAIVYIGSSYVDIVKISGNGFYVYYKNLEGGTVYSNVSGQSYNYIAAV